MKTAIILGSVRLNRQSAKVASYLARRVRELSEAEVDLMDLKDYGFPVMEERLRMLKEPVPGLQGFSDRLMQADGIMIVSPEYNGSYPGALKNLLDYFKAEYQKKVFALVTVSSGQWGGINASHHLESWVTHVKGYLSPYKLMVPFVEELFDPDGLPLNPSFVRQADQVIEEWLWLTQTVAQSPGPKASR